MPMSAMKGQQVQNAPALWRSVFSQPPATQRVAPTRSFAAAPSTRSTAEGSAAVSAFLKDAGLQMYTGALVRTGFDDMETLAAIEDEDIKDLGMLPFHARLLRRKIAQLNGASGEEGLGSNNPVVAFLRDIGLEQYARPLVSHGFDDMEALLLIDDLDLKEMGVPRGHVVKLKRRLREYELSLDGETFAQPPIEYTPPTPCPPPAVANRNPAPLGGRRPLRPAEPPSDGQSLQLSATAVSCIEASWDEVQAHGVVAVAGVLYKHVFALAPQAMDAFPPEVRERYREWLVDEDPANLMESAGLRNLFAKVVNVIGCTVTGLSDFGKLVPMLTKLGARHITYRVSEGYWEVLGRALDMTLQDILGDAYAHDVRRNWQMVYTFMSALMLEGFRKAKQSEASSPSSTSSGGFLEAPRLADAVPAVAGVVA